MWKINEQFNQLNSIANGKTVHIYVVCSTVSFYFNYAKLCDEANQTGIIHKWILNHFQLSAILSNATDILNTLIDFVMIECENLFSLERFAENVVKKKTITVTKMHNVI